MPFANVIFTLLIVFDIYLWIVLRQYTRKSPKKRLVGTLVILVSTLIFVLFYYYFSGNPAPATGGRNVFFVYTLAVFFSKAISVLIFLIDDIRRLFQWIYLRFVKPSAKQKAEDNSVSLSRSGFLAWLAMGTSAAFTGSLFYGMTNKYRYRVKKQVIRNDKIPAAFKGLKIVQISDIHSGSFTNLEGPYSGIQMIQELNPDLILFTGDLVNSSSSEMDPYIDIFKQLNAPLGVYSVLGNHDYAFYKKATDEEREQDFNYMLEQHKKLNWKLLRNEHVVLEKGGETITLIGVENWSKNNRFPTYGDLAKAIEGVQNNQFQLLMSHDPTHWEAEVLKLYPNIDLTLSGHTHGMQFGFEIPGLKWSPVQMIYKHWMGMYQSGRQQLYVNTGYGFIGYAGRVGILPEITLFELA